jgi:hypothetical protein
MLVLGHLVFGAGGIAAGAEPDKDALIRDALSAAPPAVASMATVKTMDGKVLKEGSGPYTCFPTPPEEAGKGGRARCPTPSRVRARPADARTAPGPSRGDPARATAVQPAQPSVKNARVPLLVVRNSTSPRSNMLCIAGGILGSFRRSPVRQVRKKMPSAIDGSSPKCRHNSRRSRSRSGAVKGLEAGFDGLVMLVMLFCRPLVDRI